MPSFWRLYPMDVCILATDRRAMHHGSTVFLLDNVSVESSDKETLPASGE